MIYKVNYLTLIIAAVTVGIIQADYIFEVQFHSYKNPTQRSQANNGCCDANSQLECRSACDTYLYICLTQASNMQVSVPAISQECPFGFLQTDLLVNRNGDNVVFSEGGSLDVSGNTNPSNFQSQGPWLGTIQLIIQSYDRDTGNDDYIDIEFINLIDLDVEAATFTQSKLYIGTFQLSTYELSFRVNCAQNYYCSDCNTFCISRNDSFGHYYCKQDGSIECFQGYMDPSTNCTQCKTSEGCLSVGGYCTEPYECLCLEGYFGENCTVATGNHFTELTGAIAGSTVTVLFLLIASLGVVLCTVVVYKKKKQSISNMGEGGFQENATYIDFIQRDSLNRSVELVISSGSNYSLDPPPTGHIKKLAVSHNETYQDPHYIGSNHPTHSENIIALSDTDSSMSLQRARSSNIEQITTTVDDQDLSLEEMPMKRNNSYRMLDIEALAGNSEGGQDSIYSYPKLKPTHTQLQDHGYTTIGTKTNSNSDSYSKIELSNMYENISSEDNMMHNEMYGASMRSEESSVTGLFDPYMNDRENVTPHK
ncbi:uncharacterized protein LOC135347887 [Halichondria panicea]|uniref:uncharacterized protein LOC135347887 n=1 Tax=Halichondria panicea TaxID=6063 RepID=UPI00312B2C7C